MGVRKWNRTGYFKQGTDLGGQYIFGNDSKGTGGELSDAGVSQTKLLDQSSLVSNQFGGVLGSCKWCDRIGLAYNYGLGVIMER